MSRLCPLNLAPIKLFVAVTSLLATLVISKPVSAQSIVSSPDGTGTIVTPNGNRFDITGGQVSSDRTNLFHSFQQFGLNQNQIANFFASPGIQNILGRVLGGDPSVINGLIQVTGSNANLFLMNPAGIVFGANASLNVPASFTATAANGISFGNRWFSAIGGNNYSLLNGLPTGLAFTMSQPGAIINAGNLAVNPGQTLALFGGTVVNTGGLSAPSGSVIVTAIPGSQIVRLSQPGSLLSFVIEVPSSNTIQPQAIDFPIASLPQLLTGGTLPSATGLVVNASGQVELVSSGKQISSTTGSTSIAGNINTDGQTGGSIYVLGDLVGVYGAMLNASGLGNGGTILVGGDYQGKGAVPNATRTYVSPNSTIQVDSLLNGNGGRVIVWADEVTAFYGNISAHGGRQSGHGGFVEVSGKQNLIFQGQVNLDAPMGIAGMLLLDPQDINIVSGVGTDDAEIADGSILFGDGGSADFQIGATTLTGITGNITLQAARNINLLTSLDFPETPIAVGTTISFTAGQNFNGIGQNITAPGRNIKITAANIDLERIDTGNNTSASSVSLLAGEKITIGSISTVSTNTNPTVSINGGNVNLIANGDITISNPITTFVNSNGRGDAGKITLISENGSVTTSRAAFSLDAGTARGKGGNIFVQAKNNISMPGGSASYVVGVPGSSGNAGDITLISSDGSINIGADLNSLSFNGNGGAINITANGDITTGGVSSASTNANGGNITFNSLNGGVNTIGGIIDSNSRASNAGNITIIAKANIISNDLIAFSATPNGVNGGNISLTSQEGNISSIGNLDTGGLKGNGGEIILRSRGDITLNNAFSYSLGGGIGNGGNLSLESTNGNITAKGRLNAVSVNSTGGTIALSGNNIILNGQVTLGSETGKGGGALTLNTSGRVNLPNILQTNGADIRGIMPIGEFTGITSGSTINTNGGNVFLSFQAEGTLTGISAIITNGGNITLTSPGNLTVAGILNSASSNRTGGNISLTSGASVRTADLVTSGVAGGRVSVTAQTQITTGNIDTSATISNGGSVTLDPLGDIQVGFINAQGGIFGFGGNVTATTQQYFRATNTFNDQNTFPNLPPIRTSISASGGVGGGTIIITHGGGDRNVPFIVGDSSINRPDGNGTLGAITTNNNAILPFRSFPGIYWQFGSSGDIGIITSEPRPPQNDPIKPLPEQDLLEDSLVYSLEERFTRDYEDYFGASPTCNIKGLSEIQTTLRDIDAKTELTPGAIYVFFQTSAVSDHITKNRQTQGCKRTQLIKVPPQDDTLLELLLVTKDGEPVHKVVSGATYRKVVNEAQKFQEEVQFRNRLGTVSYQSVAKQFYQWLILQLKDEIQARGIKNLVFLMDQQLRTLPLAAIFDGQKYLIEDYSVGLMPSFTITNAQYRNIQNARVLAGGISEFSKGSYPSLRAVAVELQTIEQQRQVSILSQADVTLSNLKQARIDYPYQIVHLATHAGVTSGPPANSFIVLKDKQQKEYKLTLQDIPTMQWNNPPTELLILSACQTALGENPGDELGFAGIAYRSGVKSVLASLWKVEDKGVPPLMAEFYFWLGQVTTKAEALRRAQLALLKGKVSVQNGRLRWSGGEIILPENYSPIPYLSHPYYWSGFTIVGSPW